MIDTAQSQQERILLLLCNPRYLKEMVEEVDAWCQEDAGVIVCYGLTEKERNGFILTRWHGPISRHVKDKGRPNHDEDIIDMVAYEQDHHHS